MYKIIKQTTCLIALIKYIKVYLSNDNHDLGSTWPKPGRIYKHSEVRFDSIDYR